VVTFRILTYNVHGLRGEKEAVARVIRLVDPDILCVQEAPKYFLLRGAEAAFARRADLLYVAGGRSTGNTAMFTPIRVDVRGVTELRLSKTPSLTRRGAVIAALERDGVQIAAASVHLGQDTAERARHLTEITGALADVSGAVASVIAGDVNEEPGATTWERLTSEFTDAGAAEPAFTSPAQNPTRRVDGIFVRGGAKISRYEVLGSRDVEDASDHRPVVAEVVVTPQ
jgi:endonuclease/exonuclease/phosphatase family metal-dependent hydrolase